MKHLIISSLPLSMEKLKFLRYQMKAVFLNESEYCTFKLKSKNITISKKNLHLSENQVFYKTRIYMSEYITIKNSNSVHVEFEDFSSPMLFS